MKLRDIIQAVESRRYWIKFYYDWAITSDGHIIPKNEITMDDDVSVFYQWYHHFNPNVNIREIDNAIQNHDYKTFMKWFNKLEKEEWEYLPTTAYIWSGEILLGTVCVVFDEELFSLISGNDHECG
jgi:hypothetical protein